MLTKLAIWHVPSSHSKHFPGMFCSLKLRTQSFILSNFNQQLLVEIRIQFTIFHNSDIMACYRFNMGIMIWQTVVYTIHSLSIHRIWASVGTMVLNHCFKLVCKPSLVLQLKQQTMTGSCSVFRSYLDTEMVGNSSLEHEIPLELPGLRSTNKPWSDCTFPKPILVQSLKSQNYDYLIRTNHGLILV